MQHQELLCGLCGEKRQGLFCGLEESPQAKITQEKVVKVYERGEVIFREKTPSTAVYCIHNGRVKLYRTDEQGENHVIRLFGPGDIFGFRSVLSNEPNTATAEAIEKTTICVVPRKTLFEMFGVSTNLALDMMAKLATELKASEDQMVSLLNHSVRRRTARLLLTLIDENAQSDGRCRLVRIQRTEMAQVIGTTPESLSRTLHAFRKQDIIELTRISIVLVDKQAIEKIAQDVS